jgi:hypothetical protein
MCEGRRRLLLTFGSGSSVVLTCQLCIVTTDGIRGTEHLSNQLGLIIRKLMFLSASVTRGGLEPECFLRMASCGGYISVYNL